MPMKKDLKLDQYDISPYAYRELHNFCLQYPEKKRRLRELESPFGGPRGSDPTAGRATRAATRAADIALIEKTARQAAGAQAPYLVEAVTEDMPWHYLRMRKGLPLGEKSFNGIRRQFYYLLAKEKRIV